jgi:hypothetical protein
MSNVPPAPDWFIDIRHFKSQEQLSLDLTRHLQRRAGVGMVAVITDRPTIFLSVIKKRWSVLIREVQRQYASTLQRAKKQGLEEELQRLHSYSFVIAAKRTGRTTIIFCAPEELTADDSFTTIYLTIPLPHERLIPLMPHLKSGGFLVTYSGWPGVPSSG